MEICDSRLIVNFSDWLNNVRQSLFTGSSIDVPCGTCVGCCTSFYFIRIRPEEKKTRAVIPEKFWVPAPNLPKGNIQLGYYENGHCPMYRHNKCSIYNCRPLTCRQYDCRIAAAAEVLIDEENKVVINETIQRWRFTYPTELDKQEHDAVKKAATFLKGNQDCFPAEYKIVDAMQLAMAAILIYKVFLTNNGKIFSSNEEIAQAIIAERGLYTIP